MKQYINRKLVAEFRKRIRGIIKKHIGQEHIQPNESTFGLAGNTFRAYTGWNNKPSDLYKSWAKNVTVGLMKHEPKKEITTRDDFLKWHKGLYNSLQKHWKKHEGRQLPLSHGYKLVDLYIKWLSAHQFQDDMFLERIIRNANCALDSQILERLNECYSMALPIFKPSMGHIHNQNTYDLCQSLIAEFSESSGGSRLLFDYWAWQKGQM